MFKHLMLSIFSFSHKHLHASLGNMLLVLAEKDRPLKIMYLQHDYYFSGHLTLNTVFGNYYPQFPFAHYVQLERAKHRFNSLGTVH